MSSQVQPAVPWLLHAHVKLFLRGTNSHSDVGFLPVSMSTVCQPIGVRVLQMQQGTEICQQMVAAQKAHCIADLHSREMHMQVMSHSMLLVASAFSAIQGLHKQLCSCLQ